MDPASTLFGFPIETVNAFIGIATAMTGLATASAAAIAAYLAVRGLTTWRDEMKGRRKAELAEEVLASFYEARDTIAWARSPFRFNNEAHERERTMSETEELSRQLDGYFIPAARLNKTQAFQSAFFVKRYRFRAVFGDEADWAFEEFKEIGAEILSAARILAHGARMTAGQSNVPPQPDLENRLTDNGPEDKINKRMSDAIEAIEAICRKAIEGRAK